MEHRQTAGLSSLAAFVKNSAQRRQIPSISTTDSTTNRMNIDVLNCMKDHALEPGNGLSPKSHDPTAPGPAQAEGPREQAQKSTRARGRRCRWSSRRLGIMLLGLVKVRQFNLFPVRGVRSLDVKGLHVSSLCWCPRNNLPSSDVFCCETGRL